MSNHPSTKILIVDDDPALRQLIADFLTRHDFETLVAPDAYDIEARILRYAPDLIILDRMLPCGDGVDICQQLRGQNEDIPIIVLTAKDEMLDKLEGLQAGADDYICKPFDPRELLARIQTVLRRKKGPSAIVADAPVHFGAICFHPAQRSVTKNGEIVKLTSGEWALLEILIQHMGKPLSRDRLLTLLHQEDSGERGDRAIDITILRLRKLLEEDYKNPQWIQTVWGVGYRFNANGTREG